MAWKRNKPRNSVRSKKTNKPKKPKYSPEQKMAYHTGMGYSVADHGKEINFSSADMQASFQAGYRAGTQKVEKSSKKYPKRKR